MQLRLVFYHRRVQASISTIDLFYIWLQIPDMILIQSSSNNAPGLAVFHSCRTVAAASTSLAEHGTHWAANASSPVPESYVTGADCAFSTHRIFIWEVIWTLACVGLIFPNCWALASHTLFSVRIEVKAIIAYAFLYTAAVVESSWAALTFTVCVVSVRGA